MSQEERREKFVSELLDLYKDGIQGKDFMDALVKTMEYVGQYADFSGADKKAEVLAILQVVLDKTDSPGPDAITDRVVMWIAPQAIDYIVSAARGKFKV